MNPLFFLRQTDQSQDLRKLKQDIKETAPKKKFEQDSTSQRSGQFSWNSLQSLDSFNFSKSSTEEQKNEIQKQKFQVTQFQKTVRNLQTSGIYKGSEKLQQLKQKENDIVKLEKKKNTKQSFASFLFQALCAKGGSGMCLSISELNNLITSMVPWNHEINQYRMQFGNMDQCISSIDVPFFIRDQFLLKMKEKSEIESLYKAAQIPAEDFYTFQQHWKLIYNDKLRVMRNLSQNVCKVCNKEFFEAENSQYSCDQQGSGQPHINFYNFADFNWESIYLHPQY